MNSADLVAKYRFAPDRPLTMPTEGKSIQVAWDDFLVLADRLEALEARLAEAMEVLRDIAESDDIENALDPARNKRIACRLVEKSTSPETQCGLVSGGNDAACG